MREERCALGKKLLLEPTLGRQRPDLEPGIRRGKSTVRKARELSFGSSGDAGDRAEVDHRLQIEMDR